MKNLIGFTEQSPLRPAAVWTLPVLSPPSLLLASGPGGVPPPFRRWPWGREGSKPGKVGGAEGFPG